MSHTTDVDYVVFDFDGTLADYKIDFSEDFVRLVSLADPGLSPQAIRSSLNNANGLADWLRNCVSPGVYNSVYPELISLACRQVRNPAILPLNLTKTLRKLERCCTLLVLSGRDPQSLNLALRQIGISSFFADVAGHDGSYFPKPDPTQLLALLERNGANPSNAAYIGDKLCDAELSHAARVRFVEARWLRHEIPIGLNSSPCYDICDLTDHLALP